MDVSALESGVAGKSVVEAAGDENLRLKKTIDGAVNYICPEPSLVARGIDKLKEMAAAAPELAVQLWAAYRLADFALGLKTGSDGNDPVMEGGVKRLGSLGLPLARRVMSYEWEGKEYKTIKLGENPVLSGELDYLFESGGMRLKQFREKVMEKAVELHGRRHEVQEVMERVAWGATKLGFGSVLERDLVAAYDYLQFRRRQGKDPELKESTKPVPLGMSDERLAQMEVVVDWYLRQGSGSQAR